MQYVYIYLWISLFPLPKQDFVYIVLELSLETVTYWHICMHACSVALLCPTLCDPMDCSPSVSSVHGIFQVRILEQVTISSSRGYSWPRNWTHFSCIDRWILYHWAPWEAPSAYVGLPCLKRMIVEYAIMWAFQNLFPSGWTLSLPMYFLLLQ